MEDNKVILDKIGDTITMWSTNFAHRYEPSRIESKKIKRIILYAGIVKGRASPIVHDQKNGMKEN